MPATGRPTVTFRLADTSLPTPGHTRQHTPMVYADITPADSNFIVKDHVTLLDSSMWMRSYAAFRVSGDARRHAIVFGKEDPTHDWRGETVTLTVAEDQFAAADGVADNEAASFAVTLVAESLSPTEYFAGPAQTIHPRAVVSLADSAVTMAADSLSTTDYGLLLNRIQHGVSAEALAVTPDGSKLFSAGQDRAIVRWDVADVGGEFEIDLARISNTLDAHSDTITALAVTPDSSKLLSAGDDKAITCWDVGSGNMISTTLDAHSDTIRALAVTPDSSKFFSAGDDGAIICWDVGSGNMIRTTTMAFGVTVGSINALAVTPDGSKLFSAGDNKAIICWDVAVVGTSAPAAAADGVAGGAAIRATADAHGGSINALAVTPDGSKLLSAGEDRAIACWDVEAVVGTSVAAAAAAAGGVAGVEHGPARATADAHGGSINALAVTPDGSKFFSAGEGGVITCWDVDSGDEIRTTTHANGGTISALAVAPDGLKLFSAGFDETIGWHVASGEEIHVVPSAQSVRMHDGLTPWPPGPYNVILTSLDGPVVYFDVTPEDAYFSLDMVTLTYPSSFAQSPVLGPLVGADPVGGSKRYASRLTVGADWEEKTIGITVASSQFGTPSQERATNLPDWYFYVRRSTHATWDQVQDAEAAVVAANTGVTVEEALAHVVRPAAEAERTAVTMARWRAGVAAFDAEEAARKAGEYAVIARGYEQELSDAQSPNAPVADVAATDAETASGAAAVDAAAARRGLALAQSAGDKATAEEGAAKAEAARADAQDEEATAEAAAAPAGAANAPQRQKANAAMHAAETAAIQARVHALTARAYADAEPTAAAAGSAALAAEAAADEARQHMVTARTKGETALQTVGQEAQTAADEAADAAEAAKGEEAKAEGAAQAAAVAAPPSLAARVDAAVLSAEASSAEAANHALAARAYGDAATGTWRRTGGGEAPDALTAVVAGGAAETAGGAAKDAAKEAKRIKDDEGPPYLEAAALLAEAEAGKAATQATIAETKKAVAVYSAGTAAATGLDIYSNRQAVIAAVAATRAAADKARDHATTAEDYRAEAPQDQARVTAATAADAEATKAETAADAAEAYIQADGVISFEWPPDRQDDQGNPLPPYMLMPHVQSRAPLNEFSMLALAATQGIPSGGDWWASPLTPSTPYMQQAIDAENAGKTAAKDAIAAAVASAVADSAAAASSANSKATDATLNAAIARAHATAGATTFVLTQGGENEAKRATEAALAAEAAATEARMAAAAADAATVAAGEATSKAEAEAQRATAEAAASTAEAAASTAEAEKAKAEAEGRMTPEDALAAAPAIIQEREDAEAAASAAAAAAAAPAAAPDERVVKARQKAKAAAAAAGTYSGRATADALDVQTTASAVEAAHGAESDYAKAVAGDALAAQAAAGLASAKAGAAQVSANAAEATLDVDAAEDSAEAAEAAKQGAAGDARAAEEAKEIAALRAAAMDAVEGASTAAASAAAEASAARAHANAVSGGGQYAATADALAKVAETAVTAAANAVIYARARRDEALAATDLATVAAAAEAAARGWITFDELLGTGEFTGRLGAEEAATRAAEANAALASADSAEAQALAWYRQRATDAAAAAAAAASVAAEKEAAAKAYAALPAVAASQYATQARNAASAAEAASAEAAGFAAAAAGHAGTAQTATASQAAADSSSGDYAGPAALAAEAAAQDAEAAAAAAAAAEVLAAEAATLADARPTVVITSKDGAEVQAATTLYFDVTPWDSTFCPEDVVVTGGIPGNMYSTHVQGADTTRFWFTVTMTHANCTVSVAENTFQATGDSQDNNLPSTLNLTALNIDVDAVATAVAAAAVVVTATTGHDPYVRSANGKITKIPDKHGYYRMFEHDDMFVNVEVDQLDIKEALGAFYKEKGFDTALLGGRTPITEGYWNKSLFVESEGHVLEYDIFGETLAIRRDTNYFQVKLVNTESRRRMREMCVDDVVRKTALISWSHTKHGRQELTLDWYANPQVQNGITLTSRVSRSKDSIGLFVKNYEAEYMEVDTLDTGKCARLRRDMIAASAAGKRLTHERPIKAHGEEWCFPGSNRSLKN